MRLILPTLLLVLAAAGPTKAADASLSPDDAVRQTLRTLAKLVADCRLPLAADPLALRAVVDERLRPKADVLYAGQLILGRHWPEAEPEQRRRFAEALYGTLVSRYATGLLLLTDRNVVVVPASEPPGEDQATVELRIQAGLSSTIPVYLQMRRGQGRWRIHDARWEGQSYVLSLRQAYSEVIRRDGLETVIRRLEASAGAMVGRAEDRDTAAGRCLRARAAE